MSALVILECNVCGVITPPWSTVDKAREEAAPDGWLVCIDGEDVDYCPSCTGPDRPAGQLSPTVSQLDKCRRGIRQMRDALAVISTVDDAVNITVVRSVANLARMHAEQLLTELAA